jgi:hypothetical protein
MVTEISQRLAPLARVLREAASAEPQFAETATRFTEQRRADMARAAKRLTARIPADSELEELMGTLYILYSPETFLALTTDFGWSIKRYQRWLSHMLYLTVTGPR